MLCKIIPQNKRIFLALAVLIFFLLNVGSVLAVTYATVGDLYGILGDGTSRTGAYNITFKVRSCDDSACSGETFIGPDNTSSTYFTNETYNLLNETLSPNNTYFQYKAFFYTEDQNYTPMLFNVTVGYTYIDETNPLISFEDPTPSNNSGRSSEFELNVSITEQYLENVTYKWNGTNTTYDATNNASYFTGSAPNWTFNLTQTGLVIGQSYTYQVFVTDFAGNSNSTGVRTVQGNAAPTFISISHTPTSTDDIDPNVLINITVNVSDTDDNFDSAILQYKNSTSDWNNVTMDNLTVKGLYTLMNANFTPNSEGNWIYRIWANDTQADSVTSSNTSLNASWDCTWTIISDLGAVSGWDENKFIGNITINNTGDSMFADNNCSLDFRVSYDLTEGRIYYDGEYIKNLNSYTISAKSNQTIQINATFLSEVKQENVVITLDEFRSRSSTKYQNTTATLVSNQAGPYLYQSISSSPTNVYLTTGNFSLQGYLRNLMGSSTVNENNTAYNVTFNWTLPTGFTNVSGNLTTNFTNITDNNLNYNNINVSFSNLASITSGVKTISLYSQGYNLSGNLIQDANGNQNLTDTISISFLCYNTSDSVCVTSCGYLQDPDCDAPTTTTTPPSTSSGGGGGGGAQTETVRTAADYQLVRGEQNEIKIVFENKDKNESLKNLIFSVSGAMSKYIDINPKQISYLGPEQNVTLTLIITSPTYIELGKQELIITMEGKRGYSHYIDSKKITLEIHELSTEKANQMLNDSRDLINQLNEAGLSSDYLNRLLEESEAEINTFNLGVIRGNYNIIKEQVKYALDSDKIITELESLIKSAEEKGIDVSESVRLLKLAKLSIERGEFEQAYSRVKDSQLTYALEVKGEFGKLSYYLKEYPEEISLSALFLVIFSFGTYKRSQLRLIKNKIKKLKKEEKILNELIRVVQKECFKDKKMGMNEYETVMGQYNKKLSEVIEELIEMETKRAQLLRFTSKTKRLKLEKEKVISLIKELQEDYMKKKKLETRTFELKMKSFNKRISEIEEKLATLEAKKAVKWRGMSLKIPRLK